MEPLEFKMARALIEQLRGRGGFDHWWDEIDEDVKQEIIAEQAAYIREAIK